MNLTYKNKTLSSSEKMDIVEHKQHLIMITGYRCTECFNYFPSAQLQLAHRIPKWKCCIEKYGYEVIHHDLNMRVTCSKCNDKVMINPSKSGIIKEHLKPILEDLRLKGFDI